MSRSAILAPERGADQNEDARAIKGLPGTARAPAIRARRARRARARHDGQDRRPPAPGKAPADFFSDRVFFWIDTSANGAILPLVNRAMKRTNQGELT